MKTLFSMLYRHRWFLLAVSALVLALWILVVGYGEELNMNPKVIHAVEATLGKVWAGMVLLVQGVLMKDTDGDGVPDPVDSDPDNPEVS